jgi:hypothetical protein
MSPGISSKWVESITSDVVMGMDLKPSRFTEEHIIGRKVLVSVNPFLF